MSEMFLVSGTLLLLGLGAIPGVRYFHLALVMVGIVALFIVMVLWVPETPRWLLLHGEQRQAVAVMKCLRGPKYPEIEQEISNIKSAMPKKRPFCQIMRELLCTQSTLIPFCLLVFVYIYLSMSGITTLTAYIGPILLSIGVPFPNLVAIFVSGGVKVIATLAAIVLVEIAGRKFLLMISSGGMLLASFLLSMHFYFTRPSLCINATLLELSTDVTENCNPHLNPLAITAIILFTLSFSLGVGPVPWVLLSEYLPLNVRGLAGGIAAASSYAAAALSAGTFLNFAEVAGAWSVWWTQSGINLVGFLVIAIFIKETKGKKLEEVQEMFAARTCKLCCSCEGEKEHEGEEEMSPHEGGDISPQPQILW